MKLLDEKVSLEGLFSIMLFGTTILEGEDKHVTKKFVTNDDGTYPARSPHSMFKDLYIPNDLGYIVKKIKEYNEG